MGRALEGRVALVTGASQGGIGTAIALRCAAEGARVAVSGRSVEGLEACAAEITTAGGTGVVLPADLGDPAGARTTLVADTEAALGPLDVLVNSAAVNGYRPFESFTRDDILRVYEVNVVAPLALTQALLPTLAASHGTLLNVTSDAAVEAYEGWGGYGSSKAALEQLTAILAAEQPERRIYAIDPGDMNTRMHQDAFPGEDISDRPEPESVVPALRRLLAEGPPSGRYQATALLEGQR